MLTKQQSSPIRKAKLSPLFLLSKIKKNNDISFSRQSALSFIQKQQKKINNRYGEIMRRSSFRTDGRSMSNFNQENTANSNTKNQQIISSVSNNIEKHGTASKIEQILRKSSKKGRFHSVQKRVKTDVSPYISHQRQKKRNVTEQRQRFSIREEPASILKSKIQRQVYNTTKLQEDKNKNTITNLQTIKIHKKLQNPNKIFIHFANLCKIDSIIQNKKLQKQIIPIIKKFILQQEGDPSDLQNLYGSQKICELIKQILFLQKILVILIVDLIINKKFKLTQIFVRSAVKVLIGFYIKVYRDLFDAGKINSQELFDIELQALKKVIEAERSQQKNNTSFLQIMQILKSKIKTCFKYSKHIEDYYRLHHKNVHSFSSNLSYFRLLQFYSLSLLGSNWLSWNIQFLQVCPSPYLHQQSNKKYTLVLDLDQTLIHYRLNNNSMQGQFLIRPHMFQFLQQMAEYYELGIFTCSMPEYADLIIDHMKTIQFRLYRHHTVRMNGEYIKDLSRIGRDLRKLVMIDNLQQNYRLQKQNGIHIKSWYGDKSDVMLKQIGKQLVKLAESEVNDVRKVSFRRKFL